ncbi:MAG: tetratricopeptide repeat protein, partial [bacterium]|nr:tetratricopeptide repeat protein [bacterium]
EAGIDLARLYVSAKRFDDAEKTLKSVIGLLGNKDNLTRMELPDSGMVRPYIDAAKAAIGRLGYQRNAGRTEFEAAERLRHQKKWSQALRAYKGVIKDFPETAYAPRSELAIGYCLIGLKQTEQALVHWGKFTKDQPAGPWRAQAFIAMIDIYTEDKLDLPQAAKYATLARSALPAALANKKASESWKHVAFELHLRVGLTSFCQNQGAIAAKAFESAKNLTRDRGIRESLDVLATAAKAGNPIIPQDVMGRRTGKMKATGSA